MAKSLYPCATRGRVPLIAETRLKKVSSFFGILRIRSFYRCGTALVARSESPKWGCVGSKQRGEAL